MDKWIGIPAFNRLSSAFVLPGNFCNNREIVKKSIEDSAICIREYSRLDWIGIPDYNI